MKRRPFIFALLAGPVLANDFRGNPESLVRSFIFDYEAWNERSNTREKSLPWEEAIQQSEREYDRLIAKYCRPGFRHQPIAYGDQSSHTVSEEVITFVENSGKSATVKTTHSHITHGVKLVSDFEYRLIWSEKKHRWYLQSVKYIDDKGVAYEGL